MRKEKPPSSKAIQPVEQAELLPDNILQVDYIGKSICPCVFALHR
jgi:hypothetical protein